MRKLIKYLLIGVLFAVAMWVVYLMNKWWFGWIIGQYFKGKLAFILIGGFMDGLRPEPRLTVTEWAHKKRILGSKGSAETGSYSVNRTPWNREIMDGMSARSLIQRGVVEKGIQLGLTESGFNVLGYYIDLVPSPIMYVMPTVQTMERNVKQRIDPMIDDCPSLLQKIGKKRSKDGGNTLHQKDYPGGVLVMTGANSAAGLRSIAVRVLVLDEVDAYPGDVEGEGSPIALAENRQVTFGDKKKTLIISTPTIEGASAVDSEFQKTDQRYYHVPCPHCKGLQILVFENLKWEPGKYNDVYMQCVHCDRKMYERHKTWMFVEDLSVYVPGSKDEGRARWIASRPDLARPHVAGWHQNSLYSPDGWLSWAQVAEAWDKAENDEPLKKTFINTFLAKTYKLKGIAPPWQQLYERADKDGHERNIVWESVAFLTAGADVQGDRIEIEIVGWMKGRISQQIDYRVLMGDTSKAEVWEQLGELLQEQFPIGSVDSGKTIGIKLMSVDTGYNSAFVHDFARKWGTRRVIPIKGYDKLEMPYNSPKAVTKTKQGKSLAKGKVWPVGSSYLKEQLYGWLRLVITAEDGTIPKGYCHFLALQDHYFRGITAEERVPVRNKKNNAIKYEWVKRYERNEPLDCRVYAMAAAYVLGFDRWNDKKWDAEVAKATVVATTVPAGSVASNITSAKKREPEGGAPEEQPRDSSPAEQLKIESKKAGKKGKRDSFWKRRG